MISDKKEQTEINFDKVRNEILIETWSLSEDERHGKKGYRAYRHLPSKKEKEEKGVMIWDETHMFFETIDEAYKAFLSGDLKQGQMAF